MYYIALIVVLCVAALVRALWQGARPHVVLFGADAAAALLNRLRRRLGLPTFLLTGMTRENGDAQRTRNSGADLRR